MKHPTRYGLRSLKLQATATQRLEDERFGGLMACDRVVAALIAQAKSNHEIIETMAGIIKTMEPCVMCILNKLAFGPRLWITL